MRCSLPSTGQDVTRMSCPAGAVTPTRQTSHRTMTQPTNSLNATDPTERWPSADAVVVVGGDVQEAQ